MIPGKVFLTIWLTEKIFTEGAANSLGVPATTEKFLCRKPE